MKQKKKNTLWGKIKEELYCSAGKHSLVKAPVKNLIDLNAVLKEYEEALKVSEDSP